MSSSTAPSEARASGSARIGLGLLAPIACHVLAHRAVTGASSPAVAALLFVLANLRVWSWFANLVLLPRIALKVLAEYDYLHRRLRYRWINHDTIALCMRAFCRLYGYVPVDLRTR